MKTLKGEWYIKVYKSTFLRDFHILHVRALPTYRVYRLYIWYNVYKLAWVQGIKFISILWVVVQTNHLQLVKGWFLVCSHTQQPYFHPYKVLWVNLHACYVKLWHLYSSVVTVATYGLWPWWQMFAKAWTPPIEWLFHLATDFSWSKLSIWNNYLSEISITF